MAQHVRSIAGIVLVVVIVLAALRLAPTNGPPSSAAAPPTPGPGTPAPIVSPRPYEPPPTLPPSAPVTPPAPPTLAPPRPTPGPPPPTATFVPAHLTVTPLIVPTNYPTPSALPTELPRHLVVSIADTYTIAEDTKLVKLVAMVVIRRIDPPILVTPPTAAHPAMSAMSVVTPAILQVIQVYKGPQVTTVSAFILGACFTPSECTPIQSNYLWPDLVGYHLIIFFNGPGPLANGQGPFYVPMRVLAVVPGSDRVVDVSLQSGFRSTVADVVSQIHAATQ